MQYAGNDQDLAEVEPNLVEMLLATLGYGTSTTSGEWQPIETLKKQNWLNDGNVYEEYAKTLDYRKIGC